MKPLGQPFAVGRTAEIFAWDDRTILKLYRDWCPANWAEHEVQIARLVNHAGIPAPQVGEIIDVSGRRGILYERVYGPDMLESMKRNLLKLSAYGRMLAQLHITIHRCPADNLPSQRNGIAYAIRAAKALPEDLRQLALERLDRLPEQNTLCHGDFHPANVLLTKRGPIVIDWMTAKQGHPAADVARTRLLISIGDPPQGGVLRLILLFGRNLFYQAYLSTYRQAAPEIVELSDAFMPVQAAARMNEEITPEQNKLLKMIQ